MEPPSQFEADAAFGMKSKGYQALAHWLSVWCAANMVMDQTGKLSRRRTVHQFHCDAVIASGGGRSILYPLLAERMKARSSEIANGFPGLGPLYLRRGTKRVIAAYTPLSSLRSQTKVWICRSP
jgi:hypothetical protein